MSKVPEKIKKEIAVLTKKPEDQIDFSDIPETTKDNWEGATRGRFYKPIKKQLTIRLDADVIEWLRSRGKGYQTRINKILRKEMIHDLQTHQ